ncbi:hypothetical protein [Psychrobacter fulvigenes]|nr:hypothetical protein [Psychrobacter fulvigenes]
MKSFIFTCLFAFIPVLAGCQSLQLAESPIPVTSDPIVVQNK